MFSKLSLGSHLLTINQAIKEIEKVFKTCNKFNIAELVDKNVLKTFFVCEAYIGTLEQDRLTELYHTEKCEPINENIGSLIRGEIKELLIAEIRYDGKECKVFEQNKLSDWSLEKVQEHLRFTPISNISSIGFKISHTLINIDNLMIDANSLYEYLDIKPKKLLDEIDNLKIKLDASENEILLLKGRGISTYSTPALDAINAVIHTFWDNWESDPTRDLSQTNIKKWISENFIGIQSNALKQAIDQVCRHPEHKKGGRNNNSSTTTKKPTYK